MDTPKKKKVLVVDDSSVSRYLVKKELGEEFNIIEAKSGEDAIRKIPGAMPDIITMDVEMPGISGYDVCSKLRFGPQKYRNIPMVFLTSLDSLEERRKGFLAGGTDFISKPFIEGELLDTITTILYPQKLFEKSNILCVDDNMNTLFVVSKCLEGLVGAVYAASSGEEAYMMLEAAGDEIDMVVTGFTMPGINGAELCSMARNDLGMRKLPVIVMSDISDQSGILQLFKAGVTDYVIKPFAKEELLSRVKIHLEARLLYNDLQKKILDLKSLSKLKDDFLSIASHDLRSPLSGILGSVELLLQNTDCSDESREYMQHIKKSGNFLLSLVNDILDLSRSSSENVELEMSPVQLMDIVNLSIDSLKYMAKPKGISITLKENNINYSVISGDQNSLTRIFNNIISNAIKFTPNNGSVTISFEIRENSILVKIQDTGIGIPKDKLATIFNKFSESSRSGTSGEKSTGLGLSITKELVNRHGGKISVMSGVNAGTSFHLQFPLLSREEFNEIESAQPDEDEELIIDRKLSIMLAEDNVVNAKIASAILKKMSMEVTVVPDGTEAVDTYSKELSSAFDLILMDINMSEMGGIEATKKIRAFETTRDISPVRIVALTASISQDEREECLNSGMDDYLTKPVSKNELIRILNKFF
ncbi:MAG: response regulator [bacterium]|nr:response regulator [bacterium]